MITIVLSQKLEFSPGGSQYAKCHRRLTELLFEVVYVIDMSLRDAVLDISPHESPFWAQYGQNALSTSITMYKTDLPTLPIFGQHLRVFPYQIHIRSSHSGWQV